MAKTAIDVLRNLQRAGMEEKQAEAIIQAVADMTTMDLATKSDLAALEARLVKWIVATDVALVVAVVTVMALVK